MLDASSFFKVRMLWRAVWLMNILISSSGHGGSNNKSLWKKRIPSNAGLHEKNKLTFLFVIKNVPRTDIRDVLAHPASMTLNKWIGQTFIRAQKDVCSWNIQALICSEVHSHLSSHHCTRTCASTLQKPHSIWTTLTYILARRTIWLERTSVVMLSFSCRKTEEAGLWFYQAASERPRSSRLMLCWRTLRQHLFLWRALISTCFLLRSQISPWDEKLPLRPCLSPWGHRGSQAASSSGWLLCQQLQGKGAVEKTWVFSSAGAIFQGEAQKPNSTWVQQQTRAQQCSWKGLGSHYKTPQNPAAALHPLL